MDFCRQQGLQEELLIELGILRKNEDEKLYPMFRKRIMIPIRNKWGRIIAYTARYIGTTPKAPKYINSITSLLYTKGETLFGIDWAFRLRDAANFIIVEGAPDVLRLQSIGLENTVATLGTAWNENQFEILKHYTNSLCFIPDTDLAKGSPYGPGFKAVMAKELFAQVDSLVKEGQCVSLIAGLLRYVKDQMVYTQCIEQLGKIHGKTRLWRSAVEQIRNKAKKSPSSTTMDRKQEKS